MLCHSPWGKRKTEKTEDEYNRRAETAIGRWDGARGYRAKIGLTGEAQYTAALKAINAQLRSVDAEMRAVTSAFGENDKATDQLAAKSATRAKAIDTLKSKLGVLQDQYDRQVKALDDRAKP